MQKTKIPKRISGKILQSFGAGVVPRAGLEHVVVGRKPEIESLLDDLETIQDGGATCRFIIGRYGSGKSFLIQLLRNHAMERDFVVADVDFSPTRRLTGSKRGLATYKELISKLATKTQPDGGALQTIMQRWINNIQTKVIEDHKIDPESAEFFIMTNRKITVSLDEIKRMVFGYDFAHVLSKYWLGYEGDEELVENSLKWLRGEYHTKTEAKQDLNVRAVITDENWFDFIKILAKFVTYVGYKGLLIFFDECVYLTRVNHTMSRRNNYERILAIFNETMQGKASNIGVFFGGTPYFLEDQYRGLFSYEALQSRLKSSRFTKAHMRDLSSPVIRLDPLTSEEIFVLLHRLLNIHSSHYKYVSLITDEQIQDFIQVIMKHLGSNKSLTPREFVREFISILNLLRSNPSFTYEQIIYGESFNPQILIENEEIS